MSGQRFTLHAAVYLILKKDNKILLLRRFNTGWRDGMYTLPAGHVDGNEAIVDCMAREAKEETGIIIDPKDLTVVHTVHQIGDKEYIDFYLRTDRWKGTPSIKEPDKADDMQWFSLDDLPTNLLSIVKDVLQRTKNKETFSEFRWN